MVSADNLHGNKWFMAQAQLWMKTRRQAMKGGYGLGKILNEQYDPSKSAELMLSVFSRSWKVR